MKMTKELRITVKGTKKECEEFWHQLHSFYGVEIEELDDLFIQSCDDY